MSSTSTVKINNFRRFIETQEDVRSEDIEIFPGKMVAFVVKRDGLLTRKQNIAVGWGSGISITMIVVSLEWKNYGGKPNQLSSGFCGALYEYYSIEFYLLHRKNIFMIRLNLVLQHKAEKVV